MCVTKVQSFKEDWMSRSEKFKINGDKNEKPGRRFQQARSAFRATNTSSARPRFLFQPNQTKLA
jgi:hypothetical protein